MDIDREILDILKDDARISVSEMADMLNISTDEVEKRINSLKGRGIIRKFKTCIDWRRFGVKKAKAIIRVKVVPQERAGFSKIAKEISRDPRVEDVFVATGEYDLILFVEGEDIDEISQFVTEKLAPKKDIVGTYTHIILAEYKRDGVMLFDEKERRLKLSL
ncbi:MAG: Lrp/AsnC family transcriptional regulator [Candidatus Altiarchaeales archaeon]|nr:MAG: Lrp/AsnC family transcriptional regulator [Candidatus Altiarchaeales archaeon]RLI94391.1 MAG: Lrp/AsnC family transcriptional regulator [Candidatus Altiarchaeales archaeon]RLI94617.1 MAG: Lrp/AsnC family transcriptional regulator [Candidatus Altiarchaeales archaeon]HDO82611.1 Lrp/AsnC family transcriptional regulator [Candidatus Altiarchaeales archaeon]HEX55260.1 Lrp/AsnC family transcriptional regulator [Candidatus Altiarchaeales archaeon]